jgi:hypothetical protein
MSKYGPAVEKQLDNLITFMEDYLLRRKFTPAESTNMRQVLDAFVHIVQMDAVGTIGNELKKNLNEENAPAANKLGEVLKSLAWLSQPPPF